MSWAGMFGPLTLSVSRLASPDESLAPLIRIGSPFTVGFAAGSLVPQLGSFGSAPEGVPYHATSTRPLSPAATHGNTLFCRPVGEIVIGFDQWSPWVVE